MNGWELRRLVRHLQVAERRYLAERPRWPEGSVERHRYDEALASVREALTRLGRQLADADELDART